MNLDRRSFLRLAAAAGCAVATPIIKPGQAFAEGPYEGPYWVTIHAGGGWDPTLLCDPKGRATEADPDPVNMFMRDEIAEVGNFRVAPVEGHQEFFERHRERLMVINGIDAGTNSHTTGRMSVWSGGPEDTLPAFAALVASIQDRRAPASFLSYGGHSATAGLVPATRLPDVSAIEEVAFPYLINASDPESALFTGDTRDRIRQANLARLERISNGSTLPREQRAANVLFDAQSSDNSLRRLAERLPDDIAGGNPLFSQAEVACASFAAGVSVSASLSVGGFDTHGDHDNRHTPRLQQVLEGVTYLMNEAERQGIADKLYVLIGSEFGRTPGYNDGMGKDHWSTTSMMLMGPGIPGNTVIGATDERQSPLMVDPGSLQLSESGTRIRPAHIHSALRRLAGIDQNVSSIAHPMADGPLPLFG
ncbi:MAG: hypothetical protein ACI81R_003139 [Bradymonadia bacterium]|jgi:hypothetical protein